MEAYHQAANELSHVLARGHKQHKLGKKFCSDVPKSSRRGGRLVLVNFGVDEQGRYLGNTGARLLV